MNTVAWIVGIVVGAIVLIVLVSEVVHRKNCKRFDEEWAKMSDSEKRKFQESCAKQHAYQS